MLTLCPAAEEGDVYVPEVQMLKMEMEMFIVYTPEVSEIQSMISSD